jgi:NAD(P)-dependent dehydrogenase (short-subunit alcohol dehydrogenase family)
MEGLEGKRTLVTAAASAVGSAVVRALVDAGAMVVAVDTTDERVEKAVAALGLADSDDVITRGLDASNLGSWWDLANLIAAFYDELDVFVYIPQNGSTDSLPMAIGRLKPYLLNADAARPESVAVIVVSAFDEEGLKQAASELAGEGSSIRVRRVEPAAPPDVARAAVELASADSSSSAEGSSP